MEWMRWIRIISFLYGRWLTKLKCRKLENEGVYIYVKRLAIVKKYCRIIGFFGLFERYWIVLKLFLWFILSCLCIMKVREEYEEYSIIIILKLAGLLSNLI